VASFEGLHGVDLAARRRDRLQADPAFKKAHRAERRADAADERFVAEKLPLLAAVGGPEPVTAARLRRDLGLDRLLEQAAATGPEAVAAKRMLARVSSLASFYLPRDLLVEGRWREAETALEVAVVADPQAPPHVWYNLACAASRSAHLDRALEALDEAARRGFSDPAHALADPDLEALRASPEHADRVQALVHRLRPSPPGE
jgi:tetratricopeptide (TPR) repeat protein